MSHLISVIVPAYNVEKYIGRCLESICKQTYINIEVIVVNDGSTDATEDVIEEHAKMDSRIIYVNKKNGGVTSARIEGIKRASGDYIGFVDGDDEIEPDMYERLIDNAEKYNVQISHCGYQMCFEDGRIHYFHNSGLILKRDKVTALQDLLSGVIIEPGLCNKLFHKSLFHKILKGDAIDTSIRINEDLLMNFHLFSAAESVVFEDWCPYHYIVRTGSASRSKMNTNKIYDPIRVKKIILSEAADEIQVDAKRAYINTCINTYNTLLFAEEKYQIDLQRVRNLLKQEKASFTLLGTKRLVMIRMITIAPIFYKVIYRIYSKYFQKNVYF